MARGGKQGGETCISITLSSCKYFWVGIDPFHQDTIYQVKTAAMCVDINYRPVSRGVMTESIKAKLISMAFTHVRGVNNISRLFQCSKHSVSTSFTFIAMILYVMQIRIWAARDVCWNVCVVFLDSANI